MATKSNEEFFADPEETPLHDEDDFSWGDKPVQEVTGSAHNISVYGPPSKNPSVHLRYCFYPSWRWQLFPVITYLLLCIAAIALSNFSYTAPWMIIKGPLFTISGTAYYLHVPWFIFIPGFVLARILLKIYDAKYIIDDRGVEAQVGLVSLSLKQPRLRWEDIRGVEPVQTLWERVIGIGTVLIGSAMTSEPEIAMRGVANPRAIQLLAQEERDRSIKRLRKGTRGAQKALLD